MFVESGEVFALKVKGDSMIRAGILDGDYVIIRRQDTVEEGEIAAVLINGEGTLKRWHTRPDDTKPEQRAPGHEAPGQETWRESGYGPESDIEMTHRPRRVSLEPANERFDPIEITEEDTQSLLVFGKYVGLVRGNLRLL
jgi:SOS-response transcriptional repressor LexA